MKTAKITVLATAVLAMVMFGGAAYCFLGGADPSRNMGNYRSFSFYADRPGNAASGWFQPGAAPPNPSDEFWFDNSGNFNLSEGLNVPGSVNIGVTGAGFDSSGNAHGPGGINYQQTLTLSVPVSGVNTNELITGQNLIPDSAFTKDSYISPQYWSLRYPSNTWSGFTATGPSGSPADSLVFTGPVNGSPTAAESPPFYLPYSDSGSYAISFSISADLVNLTAGTATVALYAAPNGYGTYGTSVGGNSPIPLGASYCSQTLTPGESGTFRSSCTVPANTGPMLLMIGLGNATIPPGQTISFSQPQANIGALASYQKTVGFNAFSSSAYPAGSTVPGGGGPILWPYLESFVPQVMENTLAGPHQSLTLTTTPQYVNWAVMESVGSLTVNTGGTGYTSANSLATTGGTGHGLTVSIVASGGQIQSATPSVIGWGYKPGDVVTVTQSGASGGTLTVSGPADWTNPANDANYPVAFDIGCTTTGKCYPNPGIPSAGYQRVSALLEIQCTNVTTTGTVTAAIAYNGLDSGNEWYIFPDSTSGVVNYSIPVQVNSGTITYLLPLRLCNSITRGLAQGAWDVAAYITGVGFGSGGACSVTNEDISAEIIPSGRYDSSLPINVSGIRYDMVH